MTLTQLSGMLLAASVLGMPAMGEMQQPGAQGASQDHVAALKQSLQQGMAKARRYEWVETTTVSLKGEEKSRKHNRCYYGADGQVQKSSLDQPQQTEEAQAGGRGGRRGGGRVKQQIVEKKKDEMKDYMERATALIHSYVPPDAGQIQAAKDEGRISVSPQAGGGVRLAIAQYLKPGDSLTIDIDPAANTLLGLGVDTYLDTPDEPVTLAVQMDTLPDGALFAARTKLDVKAKNITVVVQNSGHRPVSQ